MNKSDVLHRIIAQLNHDLKVFSTAARTAHEAATHEGNKPDNKYDTLALEASYVAQGQANRAQEIRHSIGIYKQLPLVSDHDEIHLTSLVTVEADDASKRVFFIGPVEGGLRITYHQIDIMVITPASPLGRELIGKSIGDTVEIAAGSNRVEYRILETC